MAAEGTLHAGFVKLTFAATADDHALRKGESDSRWNALTTTESTVALSVSTDNLTPTDLASASTFRLNPSLAVNLTGFAGGFLSSRVVALMNVGAYAITIKHESTSSLASNRFSLAGGADYTLAPNSVALFFYDVTGQRWRKVS